MYVLLIVVCPFVLYFWPLSLDEMFKKISESSEEKFEDTKGAIRTRISKKNRQHNGQK
jgi:hypothetical protein